MVKKQPHNLSIFSWAILNFFCIRDLIFFCSSILKSSGNIIIDNMAIQILNESAPFAPFNDAMTDDYSFIEIVRDWNFSSRI